MSYQELRSDRETAYMDGGADQGNDGNCTEYLGAEDLGFLNSYCGPFLAQPHMQFGPGSTLLLTYNDVTSDTCWPGAANCLFSTPLTPTPDHPVDSTPLSTTVDRSLVGKDQSGYSCQLSPIEYPSRVVSGPKRTKRPQSKPSQCKLCERAFTKKNDLKRHEESKHSIHGRKYRCNCGHAQPRKDNHKRHVLTCENPIVHPSYKCKCDEEHSERQDHLDHITQCSATFFGRAGRPRRGCIN